VSDALQGAADSRSVSTDFHASQFHIQQALAQISTATLVKVVKAPYDKNGAALTPGAAVPIGFIDVQPLVNQLDGFGNATPHGTVYRLSYYRHSGGNGAFITDPVVGDIGKMVVADRDTSVVRSTNAAANPGSRRKFSKEDGTYFGTTQGATAPTQYFAWLAKGFNITDAYGNTMVGTQNGVLINGCLINKSGDVITKNGKNLDTHIHTGVTSGNSNSGPPV
jgi:hypothetical protein